jgi:hypothetical protein
MTARDDAMEEMCAALEDENKRLRGTLEEIEGDEELVGDYIRRKVRAGLGVTRPDVVHIERATELVTPDRLREIAAAYGGGDTNDGLFLMMLSDAFEDFDKAAQEKGEADG